MAVQAIVQARNIGDDHKLLSLKDNASSHYHDTEVYIMIGINAAMDLGIIWFYFCKETI